MVAALPPAQAAAEFLEVCAGPSAEEAEAPLIGSPTLPGTLSAEAEYARNYNE